MLFETDLDASERGCASSLQFDAIASGEQSFAEAPGLTEHLAGCERCQRRWREISEFAAGAAPRLPPFSELIRGRTPAPEATRARLPKWAFVGLAAALAGTLVLSKGLISAPNALDSEAGTRSKGSARLGFYVQRGASATRGGPGERLHPGDTLSFAFSSVEPGFVGVLSLDASGEASVYYPSGSRAASLSRGEQLSATSVVLDSVLGHEQLFGVFCQHEFELESLRRTLATERKLPALPGCSVDQLDVEKRGP